MVFGTERVIVRPTEISLGKTTLHLYADGCFKCGENQSENWHPTKQVTLRVQGQIGIEHLVFLSQCDKCYREEAGVG